MWLEKGVTATGDQTLYEQNEELSSTLDEIRAESIKVTQCREYIDYNLGAPVAESVIEMPCYNGNSISGTRTVYNYANFSAVIYYDNADSCVGYFIISKNSDFSPALFNGEKMLSTTIEGFAANGPGSRFMASGRYVSDVPSETYYIEYGYHHVATNGCYLGLGYSGCGFSDVSWTDSLQKCKNDINSNGFVINKIEEEYKFNSYCNNCADLRVLKPNIYSVFINYGDWWSDSQKQNDINTRDLLESELTGEMARTVLENQSEFSLNELNKQEQQKLSSGDISVIDAEEMTEKLALLQIIEEINDNLGIPVSCMRLDVPNIDGTNTPGCRAVYENKYYIIIVYYDDADKCFGYFIVSKDEDYLPQLYRDESLFSLEQAALNEMCSSAPCILSEFTSSHPANSQYYIEYYLGKDGDADCFVGSGYSDFGCVSPQWGNAIAARISDFGKYNNNRLLTSDVTDMHKAYGLFSEMRNLKPNTFSLFLSDSNHNIKELLSEELYMKMVFGEVDYNMWHD